MINTYLFSFIQIFYVEKNEWMVKFQKSISQYYDAIYSNKNGIFALGSNIAEPT